MNPASFLRSRNAPVWFVPNFPIGDVLTILLQMFHESGGEPHVVLISAVRQPASRCFVDIEWRITAPAKACGFAAAISDTDAGRVSSEISFPNFLTEIERYCDRGRVGTEAILRIAPASMRAGLT